MDFPEKVVREVKRAFAPLKNPERAIGAQAYMKDVAPFLGIAAPQRRAALKPIFRTLVPESSDALGHAAHNLMALREREYSYAAYDLVQTHINVADRHFLKRHCQQLIITKSWWDTVDGLGTAAVSPLTIRFPSKSLIDTWIESPNIWLVRAAIQHQRGRRKNTEVEYVLSLCARQSESHEFFITKAVGWALRDIAAFNKTAVRNYLRDFPELDRVAVREAERGLHR